MKNLLIIIVFLFSITAQSQIIITSSSATSGTITGNTTQQDQIVAHDAGATVTMTIAFPNPPRDNQSFTIGSVGGITTLTLTAVTGTIANLITTLATGGSVTYRYSLSMNKWIKI